MSTQPTLSDFESEPEVQTVREYERTLEERGAVYGGACGDTTTPTAPVPHCRGCGRELEAREREVGRTMGDNDDCVPCCRECVGEHVERERIDTVVTTTSAVSLYRQDERDARSTTFMHAGGSQ